MQMSNFNKLARKFTKRVEIVHKSSIMMNNKRKYSSEKIGNAEYTEA